MKELMLFIQKLEWVPVYRSYNGGMCKVLECPSCHRAYPDTRGFSDLGHSIGCELVYWLDKLKAESK